MNRVLIIELDNPVTVRAGAITLGTFQLLLEYLLDSKSHFYRWYQMMPSRNIVAQYEQLRGALYFDRRLDDIRADLAKNIKELDMRLGTLSLPKSYHHVSLATQVGGATLSDVIGSTEKFIVNAVKYISGETDPKEIPIVDAFTDVFTVYLRNLHRINAYWKNLPTNTDSKKLQNLFYYNCRLALIDFIKKELELISMVLVSGHALTLINGAMQYIIAEYGNYYTDQTLTTLQNLNTELTSDIYVVWPPSQRMLEERIGQFPTIRKLDQELMDSLFKEMYVMIPENNHAIAEQEITSEDTRIQNEIGEVRKGIANIHIGEWQPKVNPPMRYIATNISGTVKSMARRIFLIKRITGDDYAIKISTDKFPLYRKEALIYKRFAQITADNQEPYRQYIKQHIVNMYHFASITDADTKMEFDIQLTKDITVTTSLLTNPDLFIAMRSIATVNKVTEVYYFTAENVLGRYQLFSRVIVPDICSFAMNIFVLLNYLNKKYHFIHWDLHHNNIFVEKLDMKDYKIFDFDLSEISGDPDIDVNNEIIDIAFETEALAKEMGMAKEVFTNMSREERDNLGLIFDIYRVLFDTVAYRSCPGTLFQFLFVYYDEARRQIANADVLKKNNYSGYLLKLAHYDSTARVGILIENIRSLLSDPPVKTNTYGGADLYRRKYYKYKAKYLRLK